MKPSVLALFLICGLAILPAGASGAAAAEAGGVLLVNYFGGSGGRDTQIIVSSKEAVARVTLTAPTGYTPKLDHAPGTELGSMNAVLYGVGGSLVTALGGRVVVDDPARYASDPAAQACAPGSHTAVWRVRLTDNRQTFELPIFVDRAGAAAGSGATLRWCPIWPSPSGAGFTASYLDFSVDGVFGKLEARGQNTWSALVSPPLPTLAADESRTFEARAHEPVPHEVTLRPRYDRRKHVVDLAGIVTAAGKPEPGALIGFHVIREWQDDSDGLRRRAVTNAAGRFSLRARIAETTLYVTTTLVRPRPCTGQSSAPAGCALETVAAPRLAFAAVRARRPTDPKLVLRARDQARARRINLSLGDLPKGWRDNIFTGHRCPAAAYNARVSRLTATGYAESDRLERGTHAASSRTTVFRSAQQARTALVREANVLAARCLADAHTGPAARAPRIFELEVPALGQERRGFRVVAWGESGRRTIDLVSFRQGRTVVHLAFEAMSAEAKRALAAKVAARARR